MKELQIPQITEFIEQYRRNRKGRVDRIPEILKYDPPPPKWEDLGCNGRIRSCNICKEPHNA
jgi:hypothetical protein